MNSSDITAMTVCTQSALIAVGLAVNQTASPLGGIIIIAVAVLVGLGGLYAITRTKR